MKRVYYIIIGVAALLVVSAGCNRKPHDTVSTNTLPEIWPDYQEVTIPTGIAPLNFAVRGAEKVYVEVKGSREGSMTASGHYADFDLKEWRHLLEANKGGRLDVHTYAYADGKWMEYIPFPIYVSDDDLEAWGLTYRRIAPGYETYSSMGIYQRDLSNFDEFAILENTQVTGMCLNCHVSNRTNPSQMTLHVRGLHGGTFLQSGEERTWLNTKTDSTMGACVYPYWHPSGRYCAYSTNATHQGFTENAAKGIEVYDDKSDIVILDLQKKALFSCPQLRDSAWSENAPAFSPDGKWLYYITGKTVTMPDDYQNQRYDLCRIAFDAERGTFGDTVDTLVCLSAEGKSATWPRPSYDGRYLVYTETDYGYFSVWHPEARQWMLDLTTGERHLMENASAEGSYHNWSADSRWLVFTSRRETGLYSNLYLTHVDASGHASKPFLLPQRNPDRYYTEATWSFNTPDFTTEKVRFDHRKAGMLINANQRDTLRWLY